jgi:hypothetical protein
MSVIGNLSTIEITKPTDWSNRDCRNCPNYRWSVSNLVMRLFHWVLVFLALCAYTVAETQTGTLCVASRAATPFRGQIIPPTGEVSSGGLRLKIDKQPAVPWPQRESLKIEGLDLSDRHLLIILDSHGKPEESVWFRFSAFKGSRVCMFYDGYQGIQLKIDGRETPWCRCKY